MVQKLGKVTPYSMVTLKHKKIVAIAQERSEKWREFMKTNPLCDHKWYNEIVDFLIQEYPDEFMLA